MTTNTVPLPLDITLQQAIAAHQSGQLQEAERLYRALLQAQPKHPDANHNLGVLALQVNQPAAALPYFEVALEVNQNHVQYWLSYIDALIQAGQMDTARQLMEQGRQHGLNGEAFEALAGRLDPLGKVAPDQPSELARAIAHREAGRYKEAALVLQNWLASNPQDAGAYALLAHVLSLDKQDEPAWAALNNALSINPALPVVRRNHARLLLKQRKPDEALQAAQAAYQDDAADPENQLVLASALGVNNRNEPAFTLVEEALQGRPDYAEAFATRALLKLRINDFAGALADAEKALSIKSHLVHLWGMVGLLRHRFQNLPGAIAALERVLDHEPDNVGQMVNLGEFKRQAGAVEAAIVLLEKATAIAPDNASAWCNLGVAYQQIQRITEAKIAYATALEIAPGLSEVANNLGTLAQEEGNLQDALRYFNQAVEIKYDLAEGHNNLGAVLHDLGKLEDAVASYRRALEIKPDFAEAYNNLTASLKEQCQFIEAEASGRRALELKPDYAQAHINFGSVLRSQGDLGAARACYRKAQELGSDGAAILDALMLPAIMGTRQEMMESRVEFERNLDQLMAQGVPLTNPLKIAAETNFYLAFHGLNDRDLQVKVAKYYEQVCPSLLYVAPHCLKPKSGTLKKIRIGFLSKFFYNHSVSLCFSKLIEMLSLKEEFDVTLISHFAIDEQIYSSAVGHREYLPHDLTLARKKIAALELDIIVYLDIGMEPMSYFLAFSRLARVQCVLGGHPVTTGIGNVDYFLSTGLMEPLDAEDHYSEKLIRMPRPLVYFSRPTLPSTYKTLKELGLPEGKRIYICPMMLQKFHPDFDTAITRILQLDRNGIVVMFEDQKFAYWKLALLKRFEKTIPAEIRERIVFLPWLKGADFISSIAAADVVLDPFHFGIGSTAIMTFATGTPLVTRTGEFMRGRVGTAFCKMMDLPECIAEDAETYAQKAVQIASDRVLREEIRTKIFRNSQTFYDNPQLVDDLAVFFSSLN